MNKDAWRDIGLAATAFTFGALGLWLWGLILGWWH